MSLIVLNSKGSDPEDFSNFMTEQIKFPKNAEVCLVSSNINRKMMVAHEAQIAAGSNSFGLQLGHGTLLQNGTRDGTLYTPHSPLEINIETKGKNFPIKAIGVAVGDEMNANMNNPDKIGISNIARGWASASAGVAPFTFWNTPQVIDADGSEGTRGDWVVVAGKNNIGQGGNNTTSGLGGEISFPGGVDYEKWITLNGNDENSNFADTKPIWNTHNGATLGTFTPTATNRNIVGGGWCWRFRTDGGDVTQTLSMRGGIFDNTTFTSQDIYNVNSNTNKLNGGTAYTVWWELTDPNAAPGLQIDFYARKPGSKPVRGINDKNDPNVVNWARAQLPAAPVSLQTVGIRPVIDTTGANPVYVLEAYTGVVDFGNTYTTPPAAATDGGLAGKITIADPANITTWTPTIGGGTLNFDLYRHLPLRMGANTGALAAEPSGPQYNIFCSAIHHNDENIQDMVAGDLTNYSPFTFLLGDLSPLQQALPQAQGGSWDAGCRQVLRKSTLGTVLGYVGHSGLVAAAAMPPAQAGLPADLDLGLTYPENLNLVVTLPDLPITGYYGNSSGDGASGTLNLNSGGNSAAILGVIPLGDRPFKDPTAGEEGWSNNCRGHFFASPVENYICLNNPAPFSVSSIRVRITDALGNTPRVLDPTSTITIKVKKQGRDEDFRQGGMNGVYPTPYMPE